MRAPSHGPEGLKNVAAAATTTRPRPPVGATRAPDVRRRGSRAPIPLVAAAVLVACVLLLPLAFLVLEAVQYGWTSLEPVLFRGLTGTLLWNTVSLGVVVTALCAVIGTGAALLVERTELPGRRLWAILVVVPL
ncbi:MAG: iron transporter permease, partial [Acidimicrobiaceae bacterium]|nr:iron transporter permease [Acidimicrobiaceae bacterium]